MKKVMLGICFLAGMMHLNAGPERTKSNSLGVDEATYLSRCARETASKQFKNQPLAEMIVYFIAGAALRGLMSNRK